MGITYKEALMYVMRSIEKIPALIEGLKYYPDGFQGSVKKLQEDGTHIDLSSTEDRLYSAMGSVMWINIFVSLITVLSVTMLGSYLRPFVLIGGIFNVIMTTAVSVCIVAAIVYVGKKYTTKWHLMIIKVVIVLSFLNMIITVFGVLATLGGSLITGYFSIYKVVSILLSLFSAAVTLLGSGVILTSINSGVVVKVNKTDLEPSEEEFIVNPEVSEEDETFELWEENEEVKGKTCSNCNEVIEGNIKFCSNCGNQIV